MTRDATALPVVRVWSDQGTEWALEGEVAEYQALDFTPTFNDAASSSWTLNLSYDNEQALLLQKDRLVTIDWRDRRTTWRIVPRPASDDTTGQPNNEVTGVGALSMLGWELAWPNPAVDINSQPVLADTDPAPYKGAAETVIKQLVSQNYASASPSGPARSIVVPASTGLGTVQPARPQIDNLLELVQNLAKLGGVGVDVGLVNVGGPDSTRAKLTLLVWAPADRSKEVLLTQAAGTLGAWDQTETEPTATKAVVAGGGTGGVDRFRTVITTPASVAAAAAWGGHRVVFVDGPSSFDPDEIRQAGEQALLDGAATTTLTLTSSESEGQLAVYDFWPGDKITGQAIEGATPVVEPITSLEVTVDVDNGVSVAATTGNPDTTDPQTDLAGQVGALKQIIRRLQTRT